MALDNGAHKRKSVDVVGGRPEVGEKSKLSALDNGDRMDGGGLSTEPAAAAAASNGTAAKTEKAAETEKAAALAKADAIKKDSAVAAALAAKMADPGPRR